MQPKLLLDMMSSHTVAYNSEPEVSLLPGKWEFSKSVIL